MSEPTRRRGQASRSATDTGAAAARVHTVRRVGIQPVRGDLVDAIGLLLSALIAFSGFSHTYSGSQYLVVALVGVLLGGIVSYAAHLLRQPVIVLIAAGVLLFFVLGGALTLRHAPGASALPTSHTLSQLGHQSVDGWKDLLTTLPPVDGSGPLLVLPYLMGLFVGLGGIALATRTRAAFAPVAVGFVAFVVVILLGSRTVDLLSWRAAGFLVLALAWGAARSARLRPVVQTGSRRIARVGTAVAALAVTAVVAMPLGSHLPGTGSHDRFVLRDHVAPPFDLGDYPSPLAEYQRYVQCDTTTQTRNAGTALFTVSGTFPSNTVLRFAALDDYNGTVWQATNDTSSSHGVRNAFLKVGPTLDDPAPGKTSTLTVSIPPGTNPSYFDYWLPSAGAVKAISFSGPKRTNDARDFRYNFATRTGVVPGDLGAGDSYTLRVADTVPRILRDSDHLSGGGALPPVPGVPMDFVGKAIQGLVGAGGSGDAGSAGQVLALAHQLRAKGKLTDCRNDFTYYLAGHSAGRLTDYAVGLSGGTGGVNPPFLGDNEQSAALYALMVESLGVPARVVVGVGDPNAVVPGRTITASDVSAWVEVEAADSKTWLTIPTSEFNPVTKPETKPLQQPQPNDTGRIVPPPAQGRAKSVLDDGSAANGAPSGTAPGNHSGGLGIPAWVATVVTWGGPPIGLIVLVCGSITGAKALRRRRRRSRGTPAERLAHGWREVLDQARDLGATVRAGCTRGEHAAALRALGVDDLARQADASVFGPAEPTDHDATGYWRDVDTARQRLLQGLGRMRRARARFSLASFRRIRPETGSAP